MIQKLKQCQWRMILLTNRNLQWHRRDIAIAYLETWSSFMSISPSCRIWQFPPFVFLVGKHTPWKSRQANSDWNSDTVQSITELCLLGVTWGYYQFAGAGFATSSMPFFQQLLWWKSLWNDPDPWPPLNGVVAMGLKACPDLGICWRGLAIHQWELPTLYKTCDFGLIFFGLISPF